MIIIRKISSLLGIVNIAYQRNFPINNQRFALHSWPKIINRWPQFLAHARTLSIDHADYLRLSLGVACHLVALPHPCQKVMPSTRVFRNLVLLILVT